MRLPPAPDLGAPRRLAPTALAVTLVMSVILGVMYWGKLGATLGDTDDATRLVLVRALSGGQGWWDQHLTRFQPPAGVYMHWSPLLTAAIAALDKLFQLLLSTDDAETAMRFTWPLLLIFPIVLATLVLAKRLGCALMGGAVVLICAVMLASDIDLYTGQFHPGRIDHHNVQMTLCLLALAGATGLGRNVRGAALAGLSTGLGLAIGLEAMPFEAIIGAGLALRLALEPDQGPAAQTYAVCLLAATALAFGVQTPPWRWGMEACDAIALNLVAGVAVACLGLFVTAALAAGRNRWVRLGALAVTAAAAGAVYLTLYPNCRHGFFADVDPRIYPVWLNFVQEVRPIRLIWKHDQVLAASFIVGWGIGIVAWLAIGLRRERRAMAAWWINGACLIAGVAAATSAVRMSGYAEWFAIPPIAAAAVEIARRYRQAGLFAAVLAGAAATPLTASGVAMQVVKQIERKPPKPGARPAPKTPPANTGDACFDTDAYDDLADAAPPGLVLSEVDLGPFILAHTDHSALSGPYHRLSRGILQAHAILAAKADSGSDVMARKAGVAYVLECRAHHRHGDRDGMLPDSLQKRLDAGKPPAWLLPLSPKDAPLQAYRVAPAPGSARAAVEP